MIACLKVLRTLRQRDVVLKIKVRSVNKKSRIVRPCLEFFASLP